MTHAISTILNAILVLVIIGSMPLMAEPVQGTISVNVVSVATADEVASGLKSAEYVTVKDCVTVDDENCIPVEMIEPAAGE